MLGDLGALTGRVSERFKRRFWGPTFRCPVCHLELAAGDLDEHHLMVCPLCGVVLSVEAVYGHMVPVVLDIELHRPQPRGRWHPLATHLPIGLFPFALLGAAVLFVASLARYRLPGFGRLVPWAGTLADAVLVLLAVSVAATLATVASGLWDWWRRYRGRRYRQLDLKIACSVSFLVLGVAAVALHAGGLVFATGSGLVDVASAASLAVAVGYLALLALGMVLLAILGHIGGTLVFGR